MYSKIRRQNRQANATYQPIGRANDKILKDTFDISEYILDSVQVVTVPGDGFGASGHIRFSYATNRGIIKEGMNRVKKALNEIEE